MRPHSAVDPSGPALRGRATAQAGRAVAERIRWSAVCRAAAAAIIEPFDADIRG
jgi:hypothetical protein